MKYKFFDPDVNIEIEFDENKTIKELIEKVFEEYDFYENNGIDVCTIYDVKNYHVVNDNNNKIKDEKLSNNLCFAYYKKKQFLYVEGGWGHHMIDMDIVKEINDPIMFNVTYDHVMRYKTFVSCKDFKFMDLYDGLINDEYINNTKTVSLYKIEDLTYFHIIDINISDCINKSIYDILLSYGNINELVLKFK